MVTKRLERLIKELLGSTMLLIVFETVWVATVINLDIVSNRRAPIVNFTIWELYRRWTYAGDYVSWLVIGIYVAAVIFFVIDFYRNIRGKK